MLNVHFNNKFNNDDLNFLNQICFDEELDFTDFENTYKNIHYFARIQDKLIGCSRIRIYPVNIFELCTVWVDKNFRNKGIAKNMINHLISEINYNIYLITDFENTKYYLQFGFNISNDIPDIMKDKFNFCVKSYPHYKIFLMLRKNI